MASGFGFHGGRSRCFTHWQDFVACYANADKTTQCIGQKEDYLECLHHAKETARANTIRETYMARVAAEAKEAKEKGELRATSTTLRLGLINAGVDLDAKPASSGKGKEEEGEK